MLGIVTGVSPQDVPGQVGGPKAEEESYLLEDITLDTLDEAAGDDAEATDLEVGVAIEELESDGEDGGAEPIDLGQILSAITEGSEGAFDDAPLPIDLTHGLELRESPAEPEGDESVDEGPIMLDEGKLPLLDRDDTSEGIPLDGDELELTGSDESRLPRAAERWQLVAPAAPLEACTSLTSSGEHLVGASSDLLWFVGSSDAPLRLALDHTSVASLVLLGPHNDLAIAATRGGKLWRRARQASQAVPISRALEAADSLARGRRVFELARPSRESPDELWLHAGDGVLRQSFDAGEHFKPVDVPGAVLKLAPGAPLALIDHDGQPALVVRGPQGFSLRPLTGAARQAAQGRETMLDAERELVALGSPRRAVLLSSDGGRSFRAIPGTAHATALCFARFREHDWLWVALYREASDESLIALVDVEHARAEWGRVAALAWHAPSARLWAAGGFGLRCLLPLE
jgi:hypothetical protein